MKEKKELKQTTLKKRREKTTTGKSCGLFCSDDGGRSGSAGLGKHTITREKGKIENLYEIGTVTHQKRSERLSNPHHPFKAKTL